MAKSSTYFGLRRGSTKSHTFSVVDGKQITKDRVEGGKDPRTLPQMTQRCMVATIGIAYAAMKGICDHSFEDVTAGMQCMREFMHSNLKQIRISMEYDNGFFGFCKYQESSLVPGSYVISKGSLPESLVDAEVDSVSVANKKVSLNLVPTLNGTIAEVADAMGCKNYGDICTVAIMYPKADGSYAFGAIRFTFGSGASVLESFAVAIVGDIAGVTPSFTANTLKVEVRTSYDLADGATIDNTYMTAITSRKVNGNWRRSPAQFDVTDATPTFAAAISTYPVGKERFLNGSDVNVATAPSSQAGSTGNAEDSSEQNSQNSGSQSLQTSGYALIISKNGTGSASVTHDGNAVTSGANLNENDEVAISITPAEGQTPTATLNGTSLELTESDGVYTGSFSMPGQASTLVISTGIGSNDDGQN